MRIDSHHHLWDLNVRDQDWLVGSSYDPIRKNFLMEDYREAVSGLEIGKTVVVQTVLTYEETPELLDLAIRDEMVAGVVGWLNIAAPDAIDQLDKYQSHAGAAYMKGIRDVVAAYSVKDYLAQPVVISNVNELGRRGLTFDILTKSQELKGAIKLVQENPDVQFVLDHISKPNIANKEIEPWESLIKEIAKFENVYCKVSGLVTEADWKNWKREDFTPYFEIILNNFGPNRIMFGSDWPVCNLAGGYSEIVGLANFLVEPLSSSEKESFWAGCANRAYKLGL